MQLLSKEEPQKIFLIGASITLVLGLFYPLSIYDTYTAARSWVFIKNSPNYSFFYLSFFPVAVGVLGVMLHQAWRANFLPSQFRFLWFIFIPMVACAVYPDALDKGVPQSPVQIRYTSSAQRDAVQKLDEAIRGKYWEQMNRESHLQSLRAEYVSKAAPLINSDVQHMRRFVNASDFLARASLSAWVDAALTTFAGIMILTYFLFLLYLALKRNSTEIKPESKDYMVLGYTFLLAWFPGRLYAIWYQNFYTFEGVIADGLVVATIVAIVGGILLIVLLKPGAIISVFSTISTVAASVIAFIAKIKPEWFVPVGNLMNELTLEAFFLIEVVIISALVVFVWPYINKTIS